MSEKNYEPQSELAWWVEIATCQPRCLYFFGPFTSVKEAISAQDGYLEELQSEGAKCISVEIEYCQPVSLTIEWEQWETNNPMTEVREYLERRLEERTLALREEIARWEVLEANLRESQRKLLQAQYLPRIGDFTWEIATGEVSWSDEMYQLLKYDKDELIELSKVNTDIHHPEDLERVTKWLTDSIASGKSILTPNEYRLLCKDGEVIYVQTNGRIEYQDGKAVKLFGTCLDITSRKQAEAELRAREEKYRTLLSTTSEGFWLMDSELKTIEVNESLCLMLGYSQHELLGKIHFDFFDDENRKIFLEQTSKIPRTKHRSYEIVLRKKNGENLHAIFNATTIRNKSGEVEGSFAFITDITKRKEYQQRLERIAHYDALTNLPNRVLLADRLHQAMIQSRRSRHPLAVAYLDLDGFKAINDTYGHEVGDQLLIGVAKHMKQSLREGDTMARLGGDEFVAVLIELADTKASLPILTRLLDAAAQPVAVGELVLQVTVSLGVTFYPQWENMDADQLLRQADLAMYHAKLAGKNRYHVFDVEEDRSARNIYDNLKDIRRALREDEFVLYYQPQVNMRTSQIVGVEALSRWQHPERGLLYPASFLTAIENHPLSIELGEWAMDTALAQLGVWHSAGLLISVSVNVGAYQLQQADFIERLGALLAVHPNVNPNFLKLEVLETSALEEVAQVSQLMEACREMGVSFALDDFGTGYSSLTHLKHLPCAQLKIDRSFVRDMLYDPEVLAILKGILGLATAFDHEVIAEGVETLVHGQMLLQLGCELAQGYCIAQPMPGTELLDWANNWRAAPSWINQPPVNRNELPLLFVGSRDFRF